jgi:hypothetical protein
MLMLAVRVSQKVCGKCAAAALLPIRRGRCTTEPFGSYSSFVPDPFQRRLRPADLSNLDRRSRNVFPSMPLRTGADFASHARRAFAGQRHGFGVSQKSFTFTVRALGSNRICNGPAKKSDMIINNDVVEAIGNTPLITLKRAWGVLQRLRFVARMPGRSHVDKISQAVVKTEYPDHDKSKQRLD